MRKTLRQAMMDGVHFLQSHQIEDAISDGRILFEAAFSIDRTHYLLNGDQEADPDRERVYQQYLRQRVQGKPVQYIIEGQEFMGLSFYVDPRVLIPRQDTETLVEAVLSDMEEQKITLKAADIRDWVWLHCSQYCGLSKRGSPDDSDGLIRRRAPGGGSKCEAQ